MGNTLFLILDWAEVWAPLLTLVFLLLKGHQPPYVKPVVTYLWIALFLNLVIDTIMAFKIYFPSWAQSNNPYYNVHSVIRFICFSLFFIQLPQSSFSFWKKILPVLSCVFVIINFSYVESFFNPDRISGNLLATESYLLLVYCMFYYLSELQSENDGITSSPYFWIVTGLSIYVVINFFIFLFYVPMLKLNPSLADNMWYVHNIAYIIFCIFITRAFYGSIGNKLTV